MFSENEIEIIDLMDTWIEIIYWLEDNNKNVPGCLAFLFKRDAELYGRDIARVLYVNKKYNKSHYLKYADEVEKYLMLV